LILGIVLPSGNCAAAVSDSMINRRNIGKLFMPKVWQQPHHTNGNLKTGQYGPIRAFYCLIGK